MFSQSSVLYRMHEQCRVYVLMYSLHHRDFTIAYICTNIVLWRLAECALKLCRMLTHPHSYLQRVVYLSYPVFVFCGHCL